MRLRKEIISADKTLMKVSKKIDYSIINPINEPQARRDFFKGKVKNPVLKYKTPSAENLELRRELSMLNIDEKDPIDSIIVDKQYDIIRKIDQINSAGCFDFTEKSRKIYSPPKKSLINHAYKILESEIEKKKSRKVRSKEVIEILRKNLKKFGLKYTIKRDDIITSCLINPSDRLIILKKRQRFSSSFINRLIVHEIGTHAFRHENGKGQRLNVFRMGLQGALSTEEGLAVYNEKRFGVLRDLYIKNYAGRVIAVHLAQNYDFYNTYIGLRRYFPEKTSFRLTLRAKRGLSDTSLPGGYMKDIVYLRGYNMLNDFAKKGGNIKDLYYGKIGLNDVDVIKMLNLHKPKLLPNKFLLFNGEGGIDEFEASFE